MGASRWRTSDSNRKAKFYSITAAGRRKLAKETGDWQRMSATIDRFLGSLEDLLGVEA